MKIRSLKLKLILSYVLVIIFTFSLLGGFLYKNLKESSLRSLNLSLINQAQLIEAQLSSRLIAQPDIATLNNLVEDLGLKIKSRITVINIKGTVLVDSDKTPQEVLFMDNHADRPEIQSGIKGEIGKETRYSETLKIDMLYVAVPLKSKNDIIGVVRLAMPLTSVQEMLDGIKAFLALSMVLSLLLALILGTFFTSQVIKPVNKIINTARKFSAGDFSHRVYCEANDEIGELAVTLNKMAKDIEDKVSAIRNQSQQLMAIFNSMIEGVIVTDKAGVIVSINQAVEKVFDVRKQDVERKPFLEAIRNNAIAEVISIILQGGKPFSKEIAFVFPVQRIFEVNANPIFSNASINGVLIVIHDITEIRRLETIRRDFVANVSHELKTPLTSIKGFVETLLEGALDDKENNRNFLKIIQSHAERLEILVNDLLLLSHLESKGIELNKSVFDLNIELKDILNGFKSQIKDKGIEISDALPQKLEIEADKSRIFQVLINLIDNAVKFNREKGSIKIYSETIKNSIKVTIEDSGCGIPPKDIPRIFERFYRVDKARSRELGGTGLGLSIVKHIIELHSGTVGVESTEGLGSKFWFTLPK